MEGLALAAKEARLARAGTVPLQLPCGAEADYEVRFALERNFGPRMSAARKVSVVEMAR
jgi:hypothetical protein